MSIAKPQLRGLLLSHIKRSLTICIIGAISAAATWHFMVKEPRKKKYAEFYRNYDAAAEFEKMKDLGLFQAVPSSK